MLSESTNELPLIISYNYGVRGPVRILRGAFGVAWSSSALKQHDQTHLSIVQNGSKPDSQAQSEIQQERQQEHFEIFSVFEAF